MNKPQIFTEDQLNKFYNILLPTTQVSDEVKQKCVHILLFKLPKIQPE